MQHSEIPGIKASVAVIMLFMVAALFARSWLQVSLTRVGYHVSIAADLSALAVLPMVAILLWPILRENSPAMRHWFRRPASWPALIAYSVLLGLILRITYWACLTAGVAFGWLHNPGYPTVATAQFSFACPPVPLLGTAILVRAILTPLFEEFIHRGFILHALLSRGKALAIVVSAVLFGIMHIPQAMVTAFLVGLVLAMLALRLDALWSPIITHATFNLAAIIDWDCLHANWNPAVTTPRQTVVAGLASATILACVTAVIWLIRLARSGAPIAPRS